MSSRDSGCSIFCCFRRPHASSAAKKAPGAELSLNLKDVETTHSPNDIENQASNTTFDKNQEDFKTNANDIQGTLDGSAPLDAEPKVGGTNEAGAVVTSLQNEPPPELISSERLTSSLEVEKEEDREEEVRDGNLEIGEVMVNMCTAVVDSDEEWSAKHVASLQQLIERLEAVADAMEMAAGSAGVNNVNFARISPDLTEDFISGANSLPCCVLDGSEWTVANHHDNQELVVHMTDEHQNVSIRNCSECTIQIDGKPDNISIVDCVKCGVVFRDVATSVNVSDCQRLHIQGLGDVPCICAKNTDGLTVYLSRDCPQVPIISFKCSELNVLIPSDDCNGDFKEISVPEQFRSHWNGDCWVTDVADVVA